VRVEAETVEIVFVGGTDRDAAHTVALAIERLEGFIAVSVELGFHAERGGLADLLEGKASLTGFASRMRDRWWNRDHGLSGLVSEEQLESAMERFGSHYLDDPVAAARQLFLDLTLPVVAEQGGRALVEGSPDNLRCAHLLQAMFPEARFVSAMRDGRDAASLLVAQGRAKDLPTGLMRWLDRVRCLDAGVRGEEEGTGYGLPSDQLHVVVLSQSADRQAGSDRVSAVLAGLRDFVGAGRESPAPDPGPSGPGLGECGSVETSRFGRWRLRRRYGRVLEELRREGVHCAPALTNAYTRS
jgi:sulfotransferase family protein